MANLPSNAKAPAVSKLINIYDEYDNILREKGLIEFSDMEGMVFEILHNDPFYLENFGFKHIIVDEFQDSNKKEIEILRQFRDTPAFESLMVVGDDSQAIYSFKNTTPDFIINFSDAMGEEVDTINLMENFRSQQKIIDFANQVNDRNLHKVAKSLIATRPAGKDVIAMGFLTDEQQQQWVADSIAKKMAAGTKPEDIAIIVRNKASIIKYVDVLNKAGIPARISCPEKVLDNPRVKAAIGLFNVIEDPADTADLLRYANCLHGGDIMSETPEYINEYCDDIRIDIDNLEALSEREKKEELEKMFRAIDSNEDELYNNFIENLLLRKTIQEMMEYARDYEKFGADMTFRRTRNYPGVQLITAHSSKGLEYPIVYDDISDYESKELKTAEDVEETRRLLFVSATRARDELYVLSTYVAYGAKGKHKYNRYLNESYEILGNSINASSVEAQLEELANQKKRDEAEKARLEDERAGITKEELQKGKRPRRR
jgi:Superfamily I DNA and RNA helicases